MNTDSWQTIRDALQVCLRKTNKSIAFLDYQVKANDGDMSQSMAKDYEILNREASNIYEGLEAITQLAQERDFQTNELIEKQKYILSLERRVMELEAKHDDKILDGFLKSAYEQGRKDAIREQEEWQPVEYNDIVNVDNGTQVRVVIGRSDPEGKSPVHLHIRKRTNGEWLHVSVTTLADNYRLQRRISDKEETKNE